MALLNINDLISQYAMQSGILNGQGQMAQPPTPAPQQSGFQWLLNSPGLGQALLALGSGLGQASQAGYGFAPGLAIGAQAFGNVLQREKDRVTEAEKEATRERLAAMKDIIGLKAQQEEMALRMQSASLQRRAMMDQLDGRAQEKAAAEARKQAIYQSGDPSLIKAYEMFGDDAAQSIYMDQAKPKDRKIINVDGVPYYEDTKQPVVPSSASPTGLPKITEGQTTKKNLAEEALANYTVANQAIFDPEGNVNTGAIGPIDTLYGAGRTSDQALRRVIQNTLYMKTGASAPDAEVEKNLEMYRPGVFDNKEQIQNKMNSLKQFLDSNIPAGYEAQAQAAAGTLAKKPVATDGFKFIGVE